MITTMQAAADRAQLLMNYMKWECAHTIAQELYGPTVAFVSFSGEYNNESMRYCVYSVTGLDRNGEQLPYDLTTNFWKTYKIGIRGFQILLLEDAQIVMENEQIPEEKQQEYLQETADESLNDSNFFYDLQQILHLQGYEIYDLRIIEHLLPYTEQYAQSLGQLAKWLNLWHAIRTGYGSTAVCLHNAFDPPIDGLPFRTTSYTILDQEGNELLPLLTEPFWEPRKKEKTWLYVTNDYEDAYRFFLHNYLFFLPLEPCDYTINDDPSLLLPFLIADQ